MAATASFVASSRVLCAPPSSRAGWRRDKPKPSGNETQHWIDAAGARKNLVSEGRSRQTQLFTEDALKDRAQIGRGLEIPPLVQLLIFETGPIGYDTAALAGAANQEGDRSGAMIRPSGAIDARGATKLGDDNDRRILPVGSQTLFEGLERTIEPAQELGEAAGGAPLVGMCVPPVKSKRGNARTLVSCDEFDGTLGREPHARRRIHAAARARRLAGHAYARGDLFGFKALDQRGLQDGIAVGIKIQYASRQIIGRRRQHVRCPTKHRRRSSDDERRRGTDREATFGRDGLAPRHCLDGPV